jgi:hypothetical protein
VVRSRVSLLVIVLLAAGRSADGQRSLVVTPFVGYNIAGDVYTTDGSDAGIAGSPVWGARLAFFPNRKLGVELSYTRAGADITLNRIQAGQPGDELGRMTVASYDVAFISFFTRESRRLRPFASITLGLSTMDPEINSEFIALGESGPNSRTLLTYALGLGAIVRQGQRVSLWLEGRWRGINTHMTGPDPLWCDPWGYCYDYSSAWYRSGELTGGVSISIL